jgi:hypothetical protein
MKEFSYYSHFRLVQLIHKLGLGLGNLDDLLDEACTDLLLNLRNPVSIISL